VAELFKQLAGIDLLHVPYKGASAALTDLMAGQITAVSTTLSTAAGQIRAGRARALAISAAQRLPDYPDVPTFVEMGYPELVATVWFSLSGPAGLPPEVVSRLNEEVRRAAGRVPDRMAFASEEGELSFRQLDEQSERLGAALLDLGVRPGERAMFQMGTVLDTVVALSACYKAGIIPVCSVPQYREVEIGQLARLSGATLYFVQADFGAFDLVGFARGMQEKVPSLRHLIVVRGENDHQRQLIQSVS